MMSSMRGGMSTEVMGSMEWMMDHRVVQGKVCSNMESGVRELIRFDMRGLDSNKMYEVGAWLDGGATRSSH